MVYCYAGFCTGKTHLSYTGSITENRIAIGMPPPVRDWLVHEARILGMSVPAIVRLKLIALWHDRTPANREGERR